VNDQMTSAEALADLEAQGKLFTTPAVAAIVLGRDYRTILAGLERGDIPFTRVGQRYTIPVAWLRRAASGVSA
jgi:hypothetical protein